MPRISMTSGQVLYGRESFEAKVLFIVQSRNHQHKTFIGKTYTSSEWEGVQSLLLNIEKTVYIIIKHTKMHASIFLGLPLAMFTTAAALPWLPQAVLSAESKPLPLLIWHGLGDRYDAEGIVQVAELAHKIHPSTSVYPIRLDEDGSADSRATFFGNISNQIDDVCSTLSADPLLNAKTTRVDALGFSQGGQFLRGLAERCPGIQIRSLVTFGSQHNGIAKFQDCKGSFDLVCKGAMAALKGNAFGEWVQDNVIPAQYYREVNGTTGLGTDKYLEASNFLADVNNEREEKNETYKGRMERLEKFVMYVFEDDTTVIPKESGWFAEVNATSGKVTELRDRKMYKEDWLGLKALDQRGGLVFRTAKGGHMRLTEEVLEEVMIDFFGAERTRKGAREKMVGGVQEMLGWK